MGIFKKLREFVTGGSAHVSISVADASINEPFPVRIEATPEDDMDIRRAWVQVRSIERLDGRVRVRGRQEDGSTESDFQSIDHREVADELEVEMSGPQQLQAGETVTWEGTVRLPDGAQPNYRGPCARHWWEIRAGLDVTGNDPDSGWVRFDPAP